MSDDQDPLAAEALADPIDWGAGGRVHNWKNHVGEQVRLIWVSFSSEQRIAIARDAYDSAGQEEWE